MHDDDLIAEDVPSSYRTTREMLKEHLDYLEGATLDAGFRERWGNAVLGSLSNVTLLMRTMRQVHQEDDPERANELLASTFGILEEIAEDKEEFRRDMAELTAERYVDEVFEGLDDAQQQKLSALFADQDED